MKILITGSHFTPAQAVITELLTDQDIKIVYIGRSYTREGDKTPSVESQVLPKLGVKFLSITTGRLQRSFTKFTVPSLLKIPLGFIQAFYYLVSEQPDVVLSFGGYVAVPIVIVAWLLSIPIIIHEQTLISGLANSISSLFADKVAVSFENGRNFRGKKVVVTGNPIRSEILAAYYGNNSKTGEKIKNFIKRAEKNKLPVILITGGNQGSHIINLVVEQSLSKLIKLGFIIHQTGDSGFKDFEHITQNLNLGSQGDRYLITKWIDGADMGFIFKHADLVVSRAGINTLSELSLFSIPAILIPLPYIHKDEQDVNAKYFQKLGLAQILPQSELKVEKFILEIRQALNNLKNFKSSAQMAKEVVILDAAKRLSLETVLLAKPKS